MKKNLLLFASAALISLNLASCGSTSISSSNNEVTNNFDETKYTKGEFFKVDDTLYLLPGETYHLEQMALDGVNVSTLTFESLNSNIRITNGVIEASGDEVDYEVSGNLYIHNDTTLQTINVKVVNYDEYGTYFESVDIGRLYKKNVIFFGDSITHNWAKYPSGNRPSTPEEQAAADRVTGLGYAGNYIVRLNNICKFESAINAAWSGGTMAYLPNSPERFVYKSFPGAINDHVDDLEKVDVVFVYYGTNDMTEQIDIGTLSDTVDYGSKTSSTFIGGMNYGINKIREINPDANIIFINVLTRPGYSSGSHNYYISDYNKAIDDVAKASLVKVIDVGHLFEESEFMPGSSQYTNDGLHPNDNGYEVLTNYILNNGKK